MQHGTTSVSPVKGFWRAVWVSGRRVGSALVLVLALTACTGGGSTGSRTHHAAGGATTAVAGPVTPGGPRTGVPSAAGDSSSATAAPFAGQVLVYAAHGFSPAEVQRVRVRVRSAVTVVFTSEQQLRAANRQHPLTPVAVLYSAADRFAAAAGRPELAPQLAGGVVLAAAEARLRHAVVGSTLTFAGGRRARVTAVVDPHLLGGFEIATAAPALRPAAGRPAGYLLIRAPLATVKTAVAAAVPARKVKVLTATANGFLSASDTVLTQLQIKQAFGEFSLRPAADGTFVPDDAWQKAHIAVRRVKQLGTVICNKAILGDLSAAMNEITRRGLGKTVHSADFAYQGGCYAPRIARFSTGGSVSAHSWGIAVDINVDANPLGATPHQDPRLVAIMTAHNFTWGGRWLRPDGAHFEWVGPSVRH